MTGQMLQHRAVSRIIMVATAGILLLLFDLIVGFDPSSLSLMTGKDGSFLLRPEEGNAPGHIHLAANIRTEDGVVTKKYELSLVPLETEGSGSAGSSVSGSEAEENAMSEEELLAYEMRSIIRSLNDNPAARKVLLPDRLRSGEKITWHAIKKTNTALITLTVILLAVFLYSRRLEPLEKVRRRQMESVRRQLPEFASRLVLLLGAGLVLSAAFERIVEDSFRTPELEKDYFYGCMAEIYNKIKETNGSMEKEFMIFARSCECSCEGARELLRNSNIISDNISKGVELTEKLRSESEALWLSRKSGSEERGRLAETKLTMPLTVFLLVLVVVTVSPALLEL